MRFTDLIVTWEREEHIAYHHVTVAEVRDIVFGVHHATRARERKYRLIGQTEAGRYLTVMVGLRDAGVCSLVTARDADDPERRLYRAHRR